MSKLKQRRTVKPKPPKLVMGFESISRVRAYPCQGFMLDSQASQTLGEKIRLTAWLS